MYAFVTMNNNNTMLMIAAIAALAAVGGYFLWSSSKKSEKFTLYRPDPSKNTWAKDAALTQVLSSGRLA